MQTASARPFISMKTFVETLAGQFFNVQDVRRCFHVIDYLENYLVSFKVVKHEIVYLSKINKKL